MGILHNLQQSYIAAHPHPRTRPSSSWDQLCALGMYQSNLDIWGWKVAPRVTGPNATDIANASGVLNPNWRIAPRGAFHFWTNHVAFDCSGGGTDLAMYGTSNLGQTIVPFAGFQSVPGYTRQTYRGWATNYGGGIPNLPADPVEPPLTAAQRKVGLENANRRTSAHVPVAGEATNIGGKPLLAGTVNNIDGFVKDDNGAVIKGSDKWFAIGGLWSHASGFTDPSTTGLTDLTPVVPPVVEPPIVVPPVTTAGATKEEVEAIVKASEARIIASIPSADAIATKVIEFQKLPGN